MTSGGTMCDKYPAVLEVVIVERDTSQIIYDNKLVGDRHSVIVKAVLELVKAGTVLMPNNLQVNVHYCYSLN